MRTTETNDDTFVAIDFETADNGRDSACAVGLVRVEGGRIVAKQHRLIRPPRSTFLFTHIHGIRWRDVEREPPFRTVWPSLAPLLEGASRLVAHNASFDRSVLRRCCEAAELPMPEQPFDCTVKLARRTWTLPNAKLNTVCEHLRIPLRHHDALSDAEACALIVLAARGSGASALTGGWIAQ
jgi:DNA polymerase-3 subunit epsilon